MREYAEVGIVFAGQVVNLSYKLPTKKEKSPPMKPKFFSSQSDFRKWLEKNHKNEAELLVGYYKVDSGKPSMTWSQSVDVALCFGWIDGIRKKVDNDSYCIRFTPRRKTSTWSAVNIAKVEELTRKRLMRPAGLAAFEHRKEEKSRVYSFESETKTFARRFEKRFKANKKAWKFFTARSPSYRKMILHWIMSAKQETTRLRRLDKAIAESTKGRRVVRGQALKHVAGGQEPFLLQKVPKGSLPEMTSPVEAYPLKS